MCYKWYTSKDIKMEDNKNITHTLCNDQLMFFLKREIIKKVDSSECLDQTRNKPVQI